MTNVLNILIICWIRICFGQDRSFNSQVYHKSTTLLQYKNNCNDTWRMITDDDVMKHERELLHYFTEPVWINVTVRYTPWVTDKGLFNYSFASTDIIDEFNISNQETQFIECYLLCSKYKWSYIGLKKKRCYCLSSSALVKATSYFLHPGELCVNGYIPQCTETHIAVYEQDTNTYPGIDNCLSAKFVDSFWLTSTTPCNSNIYILCSGKTGIEGGSTSRHRAVGYCEHFEKISVDFKTLMSNLTMTQKLLYDNYWINNFRESYVSNPVLSRHLKSHCATGQSNNGKIVLTTTNCYKESAYILCIKDAGYIPISAHYNTSQIAIGTALSQEDKIVLPNITAHSTDFHLPSTVSVTTQEPNDGRTSASTHQATSTVTTGKTSVLTYPTTSTVRSHGSDQTLASTRHTTSTVTGSGSRQTSVSAHHATSTATGSGSSQTSVSAHHSTLTVTGSGSRQTSASTRHTTSTVTGSGSSQTSTSTRHTISTVTGSGSRQTVVSTHPSTSRVTIDSNQTTTAEMIPNIRFEFSTIVIIIAAAGSLLILLVLIGVVLLIRYRKHRKPSTPLGPVYATVLKEMIQKANVINHGLSPEVKHDTIEEDNTYDHTTFTTRPAFQLCDVSNYDTMENMQETGEYNYQHMVTFKKSTCVAEIVDSVYNHTSDFPPPPNFDDDSM